MFGQVIFIASIMDKDSSLSPDAGQVCGVTQMASGCQVPHAEIETEERKTHDPCRGHIRRLPVRHPVLQPPLTDDSLAQSSRTPKVTHPATCRRPAATPCRHSGRFPAQGNRAWPAIVTGGSYAADSPEATHATSMPAQKQATQLAQLEVHVSRRVRQGSKREPLPS